MGEPADAPRAVDQLAWWVQHGEELRQENERLQARIAELEAHPWHGIFVCPACGHQTTLNEGSISEEG